jgi:hypothetical protein
MKTTRAPFHFQPHRNLDQWQTVLPRFAPPIQRECAMNLGKETPRGSPAAILLEERPHRRCPLETLTL